MNEPLKISEEVKALVKNTVCFCTIIEAEPAIQSLINGEKEKWERAVSDLQNKLLQKDATITEQKETLKLVYYSGVGCITDNEQIILSKRLANWNETPDGQQLLEKLKDYEEALNSIATDPNEYRNYYLRNGALEILNKWKGK